MKNISSDAEFILTAEAREYRESKSIREQRKQVKSQGDIRNELPETI